jgi:hypothetical protein
MRKTLVTTVVVAVVMTGVVLAGELITTQSKDVTSKDVPLKFVLEKTTWDGTDINIWGTVKNTEKTKYRYVKVIFTAKDADGKFIGRQSWYTEPLEIGEGQVGYIEDKHIRCEKRKPSQIEYSVIGEK